MRARFFPIQSRQLADVGPRSKVVEIHCSHPGCKRTDVVTQPNDRIFPPEVNMKKFAERGWSVGNNDTHDLCPEHAQRERSNVTEIRPPAAVVDIPRVAPDEPTREDNAIIFEKLKDTYVGDGYASGWSDAKVATDLNVPRAWVERIREQFFGEARDNEEMRQILEEITEANRQWGIINERLTDLTKATDVLRYDLGQQSTRITDLLRRAEAIRKVAVGK